MDDSRLKAKTALALNGIKIIASNTPKSLTANIIGSPSDFTSHMDKVKLS